jgi:heme/copper-type cytochrome/quinol oxidase subunit 4
MKKKSRSSSTDKGTKKLTALFVIGIILALIRFTGMGFTPLGESVVGWGVLAGIGLFMVIGGILWVSIAVGRGHR